MSTNHTSAMPESNDQLSLAIQVRRTYLESLLENADLFEPVTIGTLIVWKHKGKGFWVQEGECQFSVPSIGDALELAEGLMSGELAAAYHLPTGAVRYRGELLVDAKPKRDYAHEGELFLSTLASHGLKAVYLGTHESSGSGNREAAAVRPAYSQ
jgi:hypothetical protein